MNSGSRNIKRSESSMKKCICDEGGVCLLGRQHHIRDFINNYDQSFLCLESILNQNNESYTDDANIKLLNLLSNHPTQVNLLFKTYNNDDTLTIDDVFLTLNDEKRESPCYYAYELLYVLESLKKCDYRMNVKVFNTQDQKMHEDDKPPYNEPKYKLVTILKKTKDDNVDDNVREIIMHGLIGYFGQFKNINTTLLQNLRLNSINDIIYPALNIDLRGKQETKKQKGGSRRTFTKKSQTIKHINFGKDQ